VLPTDADNMQFAVRHQRYQKEWLIKVQLCIMQLLSVLFSFFLLCGKRLLSYILLCDDAIFCASDLKSDSCGLRLSFLRTHFVTATAAEQLTQRMRKCRKPIENCRRLTGCLHVPIIGPTGRTGRLRPTVCQTSRTDRSDRL